ncbi:MAG: hypothetical protein COA91_02670 [Robiginitomaculum sp.]|nr:MAG: hypothetical protein COA91_02670 [Robiginitomaculum sp.]
MANVIKMGLTIAAAIIGTGCQTVPPTKGAPALLVNASPKVTTEIQDVVSQALNGVQVTVAPDVLTKSPTMAIERPEFRSPAGDPIMGRRMDMPEDAADHFTLSRSNEKCVLTHEQTSVSYVLKSARCVVVG